MKLSLLKKLMLILMTLSLTACVSQANLARNTVNNQCNNLIAPPKSIGDKDDLIAYKGMSYILTERYVWSQSHIITLSGCVKALACSQEWSDYKHGCDAQRSLVREFVLGRSKCDLVEPSC